MSSNATSTPEAGQILAGKYLVEEVLGVGGMGVVVAAKHIQLDQKVAIKYLLPSALLNPEVVERFAREARAAAKIRGEHVARVIDVGQFDDGAPYMVMEHLEGHDLAKHLQLHGPLPIEDAIRYLLETCEALAEAHSAKIVHRDLKPSNMFLAVQPDKSTIIKVLDFGISKTGDAPSAALTKTSALMGTAYYMSPEQLTNPKGVDHRSDIWSLGVILYELLAGRQPFPGESIPEIIGAILTNEPDGIRTLRADVPLGLELVIAKCMQSKVATRLQSVAALAAALGPYAHARDRKSIETTARVLGESVRPEAMRSVPAPGNATLIEPASLVQTANVTRPSATSDAAIASAKTRISEPPPAPSAVPATTGTAPAVAAVTTNGMSTSAITAKPKRSSTPFIAGIAAVVIVGGAALGISMSQKAKPDAPPAPASGLVAVPPVTSVVPASAAPAVPAAVAPTAEPALTTPSPAASSAPSPRVTTAPHAPAPVVSAPVKSSSPVASAAPVPAPASSKNPLQMGIK